MKVVIIEDEAFAAEALESLILELRPETEVLDVLPSVEEAVIWFETNRPPDLAFCDIHLSDGNSFEIFKEITVDCPVIFTTAFNKYAIEAFQVNSVDYLLKPIKKEELAKAIKKYEGLRQESSTRQLENLQNLLQESGIATPSEKKSRFMVKSGRSIKVIPSKEVAWFLAEEGVVFLMNFEGQRFIINYTLDQLEENMDPNNFFRANRQLIVNISAVKKAEPYFKGRLLLYTEPPVEGDQVISSNKAGAFKKWLDM